MYGLKILVSGASIAGPAAAYWLHEAGADVTVVERAAELRPGGQSIDIRGHGKTILQRMNLLDTVKANTTGEKGLRFVDSNNVVQAEFPAADGEARFEATADIEILRNRLAQVFYEATRAKVTYRFGTKITKIEKQDSKALVTFSASNIMESHPPEAFDLVIAADGQSSTTRDIAMGGSLPRDHIRSLNQWTAWFGLPQMPDQEASWWNWYNAPGGRMVFTRPDDNSNRGGMCVMAQGEIMTEALAQDTASQKATWRKLFTGAGWRTAQILDGMDQAEDFYMQEVVQIKLPSYHCFEEKRTVFVGDAAYAPSPISGMGTSLAIIGAYILAGEIASVANSCSAKPDLGAAIDMYQERMRPLVKAAQSLPPGAPGLANPETAWGIRILNSCLWVASSPVVFRLMSWFGAGNPPAEAIELPDYDFGRRP